MESICDGIYKIKLEILNSKYKYYLYNYFNIQHPFEIFNRSFGKTNIINYIDFNSRDKPLNFIIENNSYLEINDINKISYIIENNNNNNFQISNIQCLINGYNNFYDDLFECIQNNNVYDLYKKSYISTEILIYSNNDLENILELLKEKNFVHGINLMLLNYKNIKKDEINIIFNEVIDYIKTNINNIKEDDIFKMLFSNYKIFNLINYFNSESIVIEKYKKIIYDYGKKICSIKIIFEIFDYNNHNNNIEYSNYTYNNNFISFIPLLLKKCEFSFNDIEAKIFNYDILHKIVKCINDNYYKSERDYNNAKRIKEKIKEIINYLLQKKKILFENDLEEDNLTILINQ